MTLVETTKDDIERAISEARKEGFESCQSELTALRGKVAQQEQAIRRLVNDLREERIERKPDPAQGEDEDRGVYIGLGIALEIVTDVVADISSVDGLAFLEEECRKARLAERMNPTLSEIQERPEDLHRASHQMEDLLPCPCCGKAYPLVFVERNKISGNIVARVSCTNERCMVTAHACYKADEEAQARVAVAAKWNCRPEVGKA